MDQTIEARSEIRVAVLFDGAGSGGTRSALGEQERAAVAAYLRGAVPLLVTTARADDVVDPSRTGVVPISFMTDGAWIWSQASSYYLDEYGLSPDRGLLRHIRATRYTVPTVGRDALDRALSVLLPPTVHSGR